jgi:histidinol-phosphate phosphatase family protein
VARGDVTFEQLNAIHARLDTLLGEHGAYLDDLLFCPHHTDKGFAGEVAELKFDCDCRKPKPGMLLEAAKRYNIDLARSWMIGDSERDVAAGRAAGCVTIGLLTGSAFAGGKYGAAPDFARQDLPEAVALILKGGAKCV